MEKVSSSLAALTKKSRKKGLNFEFHLGGNLNMQICWRKTFHFFHVWWWVATIRYNANSVRLNLITGTELGKSAHNRDTGRRHIYSSWAMMMATLYTTLQRWYNCKGWVSAPSANRLVSLIFLLAIIQLGKTALQYETTGRHGMVGWNIWKTAYLWHGFPIQINICHFFFRYSHQSNAHCIDLDFPSALLNIFLPYEEAGGWCLLFHLLLRKY